MLRKVKTGLATALAATLCFAAVGASAADWRFKDYDTSAWNPNVVGPQSAPIVYQEFDADGMPTGRVVSGESAKAEGLKGFAELALTGTWVSDVYPNAEYIKLYADGNYTGIVHPTGRFGEDVVKYRDVDYMWEVAAPHRIYSITQAYLNIGGEAQWFADVDKNYPTQYSGKNAVVTVERAPYGFFIYEVVGENEFDFVRHDILENYYDLEAIDAISGIDAFDLIPTSEVPTPVEVAYDEEIIIPELFDLKITGPDFDNDGNQIANAVTVYGSKYPTPENFGVENLLSTMESNVTGEIVPAEITWQPAGFEAAAPYKLYEYLVVDGIVMDGSMISEEPIPCDICEAVCALECEDDKTNCTHVCNIALGYDRLYKPCIFRYTGATANLEHRTVVAGVSAEGEVLVQRQVSYDDVKFVDEGEPFGTGIYPNVDYRVEKDAKEAVKTVTPVYVFEYAGATYDIYEVDGEWFVEIWGDQVVETNAPDFVLDDFVPEF